MTDARGNLAKLIATNNTHTQAQPPMLVAATVVPRWPEMTTGDPEDPLVWFDPHENGEGVPPPPGDDDYTGTPAHETDAGSKELATMRAGALTGDAIGQIEAPPALIDGVIDLSSVAMLYGKTGSAKSFVAVDWGLCIATGSWWLGHEVQKGPVLYIAAEGASGLGIRVEAWKRARRVYTSGQFTLLPFPVNFLDDKWVAAAVDFATELGVVFVVIDTLARSLPGGDENSPRDMSRIVDGAARISRVTGACVMPVHHPGKDSSAGARGHSALTGACDTVIECVSTEQTITLKAEKQKNHPDGHIVERLHLATVAESCVLELYRGQDDRNITDTGLTDNDRTALAALAAIQTPEGIPSSVWKGVTDLNERTFYRARARLLTCESINNVGTDTRPRYHTVTDTDTDTDRTDNGSPTKY